MKYRTIVADPPWEYEPHPSMPGAPGTKRATIHKPLPYQQMSLAELQRLPVSELADDDCCLWLWTTNRYLPSTFGLVAVWGFEFRQIIVWHKTGSPSPFVASIAPNHAEFLLHCRRGKPEMTGQLKSNVVSAPKQYAHSAKPEAFLDLVESVSPGPYLEMFARRQRLGWDTWGNECFSFENEAISR